MLNKIVAALIVLLCGYGAGYYAALKAQKPQAPASTSAATTTEVEVIKEVFSCPNGTLSSREIIKQSDTSKSEAKAAPVLVKPDNLLFTAGSNLTVGVMYDLPELPFVPAHTWVGYDKSLRTGEDIYKIGYSTRIF
jgi:hypothetical protein